MENSGRQKFEESWKEAFEDSGMEPSGLVWNNIDQKLDNDKMKRRVLFYQRLAAAAVIFALLIGVASTSYFQLNRDTELASGTNEVKTDNQKEQLNADSQSTSSVNNETKANSAASSSALLAAEDTIGESEKTDSDNKTQSQLMADAAHAKNGDSSDKINNSTSGNENKNQQIAAKQDDGRNPSLDQTAENTNPPSRHKARSLSAKALPVNSMQSASSQASVKAKPSKGKVNANGNEDADTTIALPLIAQGEYEKYGNGNNGLGDPAAMKSNDVKGKKIADQSGNTADATHTSSSADEKFVSKIGQNENVLMKDTEEMKSVSSSPSRIQSQDNAFSRMASYFPPQLKNNKLFQGFEPETKRELPAMPASMMASSKSDKRNSSKENTWLSFGAAAGSYNPGSAPASYSQSAVAMQQYATNSLTNAQAPQTATRSSTGSAYSVGLSVGTKIADRWIIHTGVNYMNQAISYTSNYNSYTASNSRTAFVSDYADKTSAPLAISQPYKVNSSNEFVSVPVQAGYLIVDQKFGLQWNAGVATDVFLRNTLKDQSGRSDKYSQGSGDESPYRAFNVAALTSTEFSYKIGGQYRIALVPGVRYSFQSVLKSQSGTAGNPLVLDIGFRFRYIFTTK